MDIGQRTLGDLVGENFAHASVLYFFGIRFYEYPDAPLAQVCWQKGLRIEQVIRSLHNFPSAELPVPAELPHLPVEVVVQYLKHAHSVFIKRKLPYLSKLIEGLDPSTEPLARDLQLLFPLFAEDFILHIFEEEDQLFDYILTLQGSQRGPFLPSRLWYQLEEHSIERFAAGHDTHDDEMQGIRDITLDYRLRPGDSLHKRVIFSELHAFEKSLAEHARIENQILFPKALTLEAHVRQRLAQVVQWN